MTAPNALPAGRRKRRITKAGRVRFLEALAAGWTATDAANRTGHHPRRFYELREQDEAFAVEWAEAEEQGTDRLEDELCRRAVEGFDEVTYDADGNVIRRVHRFDGATAQTPLKGRRPGKYRENVQPVLPLAITIQELRLEPGRANGGLPVVDAAAVKTVLLGLRDGEEDAA